MTPLVEKDFGSEVGKRDLGGIGPTEHYGTLASGIPMNPVETVTAQSFGLNDGSTDLTTYTALDIHVLLYVRFQQVHLVKFELFYVKRIS